MKGLPGWAKWTLGILTLLIVAGALMGEEEQDGEGAGEASTAQVSGTESKEDASDEEAPSEKASEAPEDCGTTATDDCIPPRRPERQREGGRPRLGDPVGQEDLNHRRSDIWPR